MHQKDYPYPEMYTWCKCMNFTLKYNNYVPLKYLYCTQHIYDIPNYYEVLAATQIKHLVSLLYQIYRLLELQRGTQSIIKVLIHWLHLIGCCLKVYRVQHWYMRTTQILLKSSCNQATQILYHALERGCGNQSSTKTPILPCS